MDIEIRQIDIEQLDQYRRIPMRIPVQSILLVEEIDGGLGGLKLAETPVEPPYVKDLDPCPDAEEAVWTKRFDVSNWLFLMALDGSLPVGGATVAFRTPGVNMLAGRDDLAVLWDIRVHPDCLRQGLGSRLLNRAADWARAQGCTQLKIESQNNNVPACRFYAAQGCRLGSVDRFAYARDPHRAREAQLIWYLALADE